MIVDDEKIPDTGVTMVKVCNPGRPDIMITSRYGKTREFVTMAAAVLKMSDDMRRPIVAVWCDSKACACYTLTGRASLLEAAQYRARLGSSARAFAEHLPGHNGIWIEDAAGNLWEEVGPDWPEETLRWGKDDA
jgi:hypothetical protein